MAETTRLMPIVERLGQTLPRLYMIAVGASVAGRPPHRSVREALPHTALTLGS